MKSPAIGKKLYVLPYTWYHVRYFNCRQLGNALLNSPRGERVREIQSHNRQGSNRAVLYDIFQTWLTEDDQATWEKLVQHLYNANLTNLAEAIETRLSMFINAYLLYFVWMDQRQHQCSIHHTAQVKQRCVQHSRDNDSFSFSYQEPEFLRTGYLQYTCSMEAALGTQSQ